MAKKIKSFFSGPPVIREIVNDLNFIIGDVKNKKKTKVHCERLNNFKIRQIKSQNQTKIAKRPAGSERDYGFIEVEVERQDTAVCDEETKTEVIQIQVSGTTKTKS